MVEGYRTVPGKERDEIIVVGLMFGQINWEQTRDKNQDGRREENRQR